MRFAPPPSRARTESTVPMINVVFLLLIFFLMTATIAPPEPFATRPPEARAAEDKATRDVLYIGAGGELAFGPLRGEAVFAGLGALDGPLPVRADADLPATDLARVLGLLAKAGVTEIRLVAVPR